MQGRERSLTTNAQHKPWGNSKWLLAYDISEVFDISNFKVCLFQSIPSRKQKLTTKTIVQALSTRGNNGSDRT